MFKKLFVSSVSACFEFTNTNPYYNGKKYTVLLNGEKMAAINGAMGTI